MMILSTTRFLSVQRVGRFLNRSSHSWGPTLNFPRLHDANVYRPSGRSATNRSGLRMNKLVRIAEFQSTTLKFTADGSNRGGTEFRPVLGSQSSSACLLSLC